MNAPDAASIVPEAQRYGIGVFEWNPVTEALQWDAALAAIFVADRAGETPFETWRRRTHPDDQARVLETFSKFKEAEDLYRLVFDDGTIRFVLSRATNVVTDTAGSPIQVAGVMIDVTTAQMAGAQVATMLESISEGFMAMNDEFRVSYVNASAETLLGLDRHAIVGKILWDLFPQGLGTQFEEAYRRVLRDRVSVSFEEYYPEPLSMWIQVNAQPASDGLVVYFQDVTSRRTRDDERDALLHAERRSRHQAELAQRDLAYAASHDSMTVLLNRGELTRQAQRRLENGERVTVLFLDFDQFKVVNDSLGHAVGDALLVEAADRLRLSLRANDLCARLGGDEFVVLLSESEVGHAATTVERIVEAEKVAERILRCMRDPVRIGDRSITRTISIGMASSADGTDFDTLLRDADVALYRAKDAGRDRHAWYDAEAHSEMLERIKIETDLRDALDASGLHVHYQPVYTLEGRRLVGVETLARWDHSQRGSVSPAVFISVAEEAGLIGPLSDAVLMLACAQAAAWSNIPEFRTWVNISPVQFQGAGLADIVLGYLAAAGVAPNRFGIEVTETALCDNSHAHSELSQLSEAGLAIAIDDFGTGHSSLTRLHTLPIDVLKIDQSFVRGLARPRGRAAVNAIVQLAHALGMETIAEGIETHAELDALQSLGSDCGSGYLLGRPGPAASMPLL